MRILDILSARDTFGKLINVSFTNLDVSLAVYQRSQRYNDIVDFFISENGKIEKLYPDKESEEYRLAMATLLNKDVDFPPIDISFDDLKNAKHPSDDVNDYFSAKDLATIKKFTRNENENESENENKQEENV